MIYNINILEQAEQDIKDIYYYIAYNDSKEKALTLIDELVNLKGVWPLYFLNNNRAVVLRVLRQVS